MLEARDGAGAVRAATKHPDAVVLDIGLPDADGRDVCQALRARGVDAPVIFLTARDAVPDRLSGFSAGGDDYLTKPFVLAELLARLQALLRRAGANGNPTLGGLQLDPVAHALPRGGRADRPHAHGVPAAGRLGVRARECRAPARPGARRMAGRRDRP